MITREEILRSPDAWFDAAQNELFRQVHAYMEKEGLNQTQLAERLGVTKGYVSQILKGEFNYSLKKLIELSMAIGKVPVISYKDIDALVEKDARRRQPDAARAERVSAVAEDPAPYKTRPTKKTNRRGR